MLTYTFSTREKIMLALLALVGVVIIWYQFVFSNIQTRVSAIDAEIANLQSEYTVNQASAAELARMKQVVADYEAAGYDAILLPNYDNTQNLMAYLNGVLSSAVKYNISFDEAALSEDDNTIHRAGVLSFDTNSYEEARAITESIARGPYPCEVDAVSISDKTAKGGSSTGSSWSTSVSVTFFEKPSSKSTTTTAENKNTVEGQDLSQLTKIT